MKHGSTRIRPFLIRVSSVFHPWLDSRRRWDHLLLDRPIESRLAEGVDHGAGFEAGARDVDAQLRALAFVGHLGVLENTVDRALALATADVHVLDRDRGD